MIPISISDAAEFVAQHHRHNRPPPGGLFAVAVATIEDPRFVCAAARVAGVAIVGRPVARGNDDDWTAEVTRLCTDGTHNACSMLYSACWRAARALGYRRVITYTLASEPGTSLRAAGWLEVGRVRGRSWHCQSRPRVDRHPLQEKIRWEVR